MVNSLESKVSSPVSTGGEGSDFERHVQASFVALMFSKGFAPLFPGKEIFKIKLQGNIDGYETDDAIIFLKERGREYKLLCQIKLTIRTTPEDPAFKPAVFDAWKDYQSGKIFKKDSDKFLVITYNLCREDAPTIRILQDLRTSLNAREFFSRIEKGLGFGDRYLICFEHLKKLLTNVNDGVYPGNEEFFNFYRLVYLLNYDIHEKESVVLSLLYSHLNQVSYQQSQNIWNAILKYVGNMNFHAGTITRVNLNEFLQEEHLVSLDSLDNIEDTVNKLKSCNQKIWVKALVIGSWIHSMASDRNAVERISGMPYNDFFEGIQQLEQKCPEVFKVNHNSWSISNRKILWKYFSEKFIDDDLESLKAVILDVLKEIHPRYSRPVDDRYLSRLLNENFNYSYLLRKNVAETLALLSTVECSYSRCSAGKNYQIVEYITKSLFNETSLALWGSLDDVLPILAEASPNVFINAVDLSIGKDSDSVVSLYSQQVNPIWGPFDDQGVSRAFEILAHDSKLFPRVIQNLGEIVSKCGAQISENRAFRTLCDILQPYHELISIPEDIQTNAIQNLFREYPDVAWNFAKDTLGYRTTVVAHLAEPLWRNWDKPDQNKQSEASFVRRRLLLNQNEMLILAQRDQSKLVDFASNYCSFSSKIRNEFSLYVKNLDISSLNHTLRYDIWQKFRHEYDFRKEFKRELEPLRDLFAPSDCMLKNQQYFSDEFYSHMYVGSHEYDAIDKQKEDDRIRALQEIYATGDIELILDFSEKIENSFVAGSLFYHVNPNADSFFFPGLLENDSNGRKNFLSGYIISKCSNDDKWLSTLDVSNWNEHEKKEFLLLAPFKRNVWEIVPRWLQDEAEYWSFVNLRHWQEENLTEAIKMFLKCKRPKAALYCLFTELQREKRIDNDDCIQSLIDSVSSNEPQNYHYESKELIQYLQQQENVDESKMFGVECVYSPMLESEHDMQPRFINKAICDTPENFAALVRYSYRAKSDIGKELKLTKEQQNAATNSHRILKIWNMIPGMKNGIFDFDTFMLWLDKVKELCLADERLEIALEIVGKKMIYTPADSNGLWIDSRIAKMLDSREGESLRSGFHSESINAKGAYFSYEAKKFAIEYENKANELRAAGHSRFAEILDDLAKFYHGETNRLS